MTEKRYTWNSKEVVITDNLTGNTFEVIDITEIDVLLNLLNEQDQRITELEEENTHLCNFNLHNILDKKNKEINQLKKELQSWKDTAEALQDQRIKALESVLDFATDTITEHCSKKRIKELHEYMKSEGVLLE